MLVASIGNSTNNVVIEQQTGSDDPWNRPAYIVIASDGDMAAEMTDALVDAGASLSDIFTEPVSPELVKLGLDRSADDLITYIRYSMPLDRAAGEQWRQELPLTILRVRDMSSRYNDPLPIPAYETRTANRDETTELAGDFTALQDAVCARWGQPGSRVDVFQRVQAPRSHRAALPWLWLSRSHCGAWSNGLPGRHAGRRLPDQPVGAD